ncbi:MAG: oligosaccharide flippase family protein [Janthinobacterium lividum]
MDDAPADHGRRLAQGFNWLGGATVIAKAVDFATILAMLMFLTRQQVGVASIAVSLGTVVEALNGLGTGEALIQARAVTRLQLDTVFWYVLGASLAVCALCALAAAPIAALYGVAPMAGFLLAIAAKQPLVAAAVVPLALMNRDLQYDRLATVGVCATIAAALTRLALGAAGAGAWALVAGYVASGAFTLLGALVARPFRPRARFHAAALRPLARFGLRAAAANAAEQMFRNVDYLLVGWFYGAVPLALYRVAFDIAMEPAMAVATLINRTALPVLARAAAVPAQVAPILAWALARSAGLVAPLAAGLMLAATPLTALLHDGAGHSYAAAATPLRLLAAAALLRVAAQPLLTVMIATGRPGAAARLSATMLALLAAGVALAASLAPARSGIAAVAAVWLAIYPALLAWGARYLRSTWSLPAADLARAVAAPAAGIAAMAAVVLAARPLAGSDPRLQLGLVVVATAALYAGLFVWGRREGSKQGRALPGPAKGREAL